MVDVEKGERQLGRGGGVSVKSSFTKRHVKCLKSICHSCRLEKQNYQDNRTQVAFKTMKQGKVS